MMPQLLAFWRLPKGCDEKTRIQAKKAGCNGGLKRVRGDNQNAQGVFENRAVKFT